VPLAQQTSAQAGGAGGEPQLKSIHGYWKFRIVREWPEVTSQN